MIRDTVILANFFRGILVRRGTLSRDTLLLGCGGLLLHGLLGFLRGDLGQLKLGQIGIESVWILRQNAFKASLLPICSANS
jgi:hypothetical protein